MRALLEPADVGAAVVGRRLGATRRRTGGRPRPARGAASAARAARRPGRSRRPLVLTRTRTIGPRGHGVEELGQPRVERRLAAAEHEHVDAAVLARRAARRSRPAPASSGATDASAGADSAKQVGHLRLQWSMRSSSRMQVCWVCISGRPSSYAARHRLEVAGARRACAPSSARSTARGSVRISGDSSYSVRDQAVVGAPALQPDPVVAHDQPAGQPAHLGQRAVGLAPRGSAGRTR